MKLLSASKVPLLLEPLYSFPLKPQIATFLSVHHLTLRTPAARIQWIAQALGSAKGQSPQDLRIHLTKAQLPLSALPALIDCAAAKSLWIYSPPAKDLPILRNFGWNV